VNDARSERAATTAAGKVARHSAFARIGHWVMAVSVLVLLATSFLPILGIRFDWVEIHWTTGLLLTLFVVVHVVRCLSVKRLRAMWIGANDVRDVGSVLAWSLRRRNAPPNKPGKYSPAQKLIHHAFAVTVLTTVVTGILMMLKIDTPFWDRDAGILDDSTWGFIHVFHGLAALLLITMVISHVYFALRPEKLYFLRSMLVGWVSRGEYETYHDTSRWQIEE
jgi:formate dehydrogenase subunit gamma